MQELCWRLVCVQLLVMISWMRSRHLIYFRMFISRMLLIWKLMLIICMWIFCLLIRLRQIMGYMEKIKIPIIKPQEVQVAVTHWIAGWFHSRIRRMDIILIISVNVTTFWNKSYLSMKQEPSEEMRWMLSNI